jgi:predicted component of type VI protein secretion system
MKLSLFVLSEGKWEGKEIKITLPQFVIGRDPQCHLRPTNPIVSKRHCAISIRDEKAFVRDLGSTNGTLVNNEEIKEERELAANDRLTVGPLAFRVDMEVPVPAPAPPVPVAVHHPDEDAAGDLLLSMQDAGVSEPGTLGDDKVPAGSTVMDIVSPTSETSENKTAKPMTRHDAAKLAQADTSQAAKSILDKYLRRPRV